MASACYTFDHRLELWLRRHPLCQSGGERHASALLAHIDFRNDPSAFRLAIGPRISLDALKGQALFGIMSVFLYLGGFALAIEQNVPTGLVALIADLLPLAIAALSQPCSANG